MKISAEWYRQTDVVHIARDLIGMRLHSRIGGFHCEGIIVETEAYSQTERGCHAYQGKRTKRNSVMFDAGGHAYIYRCYGIHNLFNIVTHRAGYAEAVLIRALEPRSGLPIMMNRALTERPDRITSGPGKLTRAMGIDLSLNGVSLCGRQIWICDEGQRPPVQVSTRIGIAYAGQDALLPWRFSWRGNEWVSR
ncbi:MAG: DNA-3-methyladenine glycosylase [Cyclobacteriaceae bacterium]|nr:DNA-3-methyladenine glycosylase [Cyclobacteriaceae bacterium]